MKSNRKGFGLIGAVMTGLVLLIMAAGFLAMVDFSWNSTNNNTDNLKLYWMCESSSNYSVLWWVNQPTDVRKKWPSVYKVGGNTYNDKDGEYLYSTVFPKGENIAVNNILYMHPSSKLEGNIETENVDLEQGRYKLYNVRYKGSRLNFPEQAVWVLDSYAYDTQTGNVANICLTNVYNYMNEQELEPFINAELINATLAGAGFHGVKGRFNEQDSRYGQCTFGGLIHLDYKTGSIKNGPKFYGLVKSYATEQSWYKTESNLITKTLDYGMGLGLNGTIKNEAEAIALGKTSLLGGYEKNAKPVNVDNIVWEWESIVTHGAENKIYFPEASLFASGDVINVKLKVVVVSGQKRTQALIYKNNNYSAPVKTLNIGDYSGSFKGIALDSRFKMSTIEGISAHDFTLATEKAQVYVNNHFYLDEMQTAYDWLVNNNSEYTLATPSVAVLKTLWTYMDTLNPKGHLAIASGLGLTEFDKQTPPIYFAKEQLYFTTTAYINKFGELNGKGTGESTNLKLFNIGPSIVLQQQEIMSGPSDTAQKWVKAFIQDQRYLRPDEPLPPLCGSGPEDHPNEDMDGLNKNHRWSTVNFGKTDNPLEIIIK